MTYEEIIKQSKETILVVATWTSWVLANFANKVRKKEEIWFISFIINCILSWFVWLMAYLLLTYIGITWWNLWFWVWLVTYQANKIIDALELITPKMIFWFIFDFLKYKLWKK